MAVISAKGKQEDHGSLQLNVLELGLGAATSGPQTITITGTLVTAGGAAATAGASKQITCDIAGVAYYIPLFNANA